MPPPAASDPDGSAPRMPFVDSGGLAEVVAAARAAGWVGVDVEFDSERTYHARLALVQLAVADACRLVDPLRDPPDLTPLGDLLADAAVVKVMHAPGQDLPILARATGRAPRSVFDTQLAAALAGLGDGPQMGYAALVREIVGADVPKGAQRTDWTARPLSDAQVRYALDDVRHLRALHEALRGRLEAAGRLAWAEEDFARLEDPALHGASPGDSWDKVKGATSVDVDADRAVLAELAAWRERRAERANRPRRWLLPDRPLLDLARARPRPDDPAAVCAIAGLTDRQARHWGGELVAAIARGVSRAARGEAPPPAGPGRLSPADEALARDLLAVAKEIAAQLGVSSTVLVAATEVRTLVARGPDGLRVLEGWRKRVVGDALVARLRARRPSSRSGSATPSSE